jgi:hypothetical protein
MSARSTRPALVVSALALAVLSGCNDDNGATVTQHQPAPPVAFSMVVNELFANPANSTPATIENVDLTYDVNDDPSAFDALIVAGTY